MPATRTLGMDHDLYAYSSLVTRPQLQWPGRARLALFVILHAEYYDLAPPDDFPQPANLGRLPSTFPDFRSYTLRDYGNRVGIFRVMKLLDKYGLRATMATNSIICDRYPYIVEEALRRGWEVIPAGTHATQVITSEMPEEYEKEYIQTAIDTVSRATGRPPAGWISPELSESAKTPALLSQAGIRYLCDWANDDQPYMMHTRSGDLVAMPYSVEANDLMVLAQRYETVQTYEAILRTQFDLLYYEGSQSGMVMALPLHAWVVGQAYKSRSLDRALGYICSYAGIWNASGEEIANHFRGSQEQKEGT